MKSSRHEKITELIKEYRIETQEELAEKLMEAGYKATQATVSRDIRELGLTKISDGKGHQRYSMLQERGDKDMQRYIRVLKDSLVSIDTACNILVVKTVEGMAQGVASALDNMHFPEVVGCIAGDDTIMCVFHNNEDCQLVMNRIRHIISQ